MASDRTESLVPVKLYGKTLEEGNIDFVLIGGIGTIPPKQWAIASAQWQSVFETFGSRVNILAYEYSVALDAQFSLQDVLDHGNHLFSALRAHQETENSRPLVFVSHSLGCFALKQALCAANRAQQLSYVKILASTLAIIFLGGLHLPSNPTLLAERYLLILRAVPNQLPKQIFIRLAEEASMLRDTSVFFQDIDLRVKVLSLYETEKTQIRVGFREGQSVFNPYKKLTLVDGQVSRCGLANEESIAISGDHLQLPSLGEMNGKPDSRVAEWLRLILSDSYRAKALGRIERDIPASPTISLTSISSWDAARIALSVDEHHKQQSGEFRARSTVQSGSDDPSARSSVDKGWQIVPLLNGFATERREAQLPCFMVDTVTRNKDFLGRTSLLDQLDQALLPLEDNGAPVSSGLAEQKHVVLCGMGGIGKTSIAIEYVYSRRNKFDAIFWIRADEPEKLEQDFGRIAMKLGLLKPSEPADPFIVRELAKGWLENPKTILDRENDAISRREAQWLIVFDNADSPDALQDYWPLSGNGSILVTSRDPLAKNSPSVAQTAIDVTPFNDSEGAELLQRLSCQTEEKDVSVKIASKLLGGLPLAISQSAAIIRYQYLSYSDFYERYDDDSDRREIQSFNPVKSRPEARGDMSSIWALELLPAPAKCLLEVCVLLDPDCIQEKLFTGVIPSSVEELVDFPQSSHAYATARADLIKRSMITRNDTRDEFRIHRVLQQAVQSKMSQEGLQRNFFAAVKLVLTAWGETPLEKRHAVELANERDGLFPHALALRSIYIKHFKGQNPQGSMQLAKLINESGWFQHERGNSQDIKPFLTLALEICNQNPGPESIQMLSDLHYGFGAAANDTNDPDGCMHHNQKLLELRTNVFLQRGIKDQRLAIAHNQIGIAFVMNRQYEKGIENFNTSIELYHALPAGVFKPAMDSNPRTNLGFTYWLLGELEKAKNILMANLEDRVAAFGVDDKESYRTGRVYHGLGNVCYDQGLFEQSEEWHQKALSQYQTTLGNNHHKTADICHRVAQHCLGRYEFGNARVLIDQALKVYNRNEPVYLPQLARTTFLKAKLEMQCESTEEATRLFKQARDLRARIPRITTKPDASLREVDFDELLTFFCR